MPGDRAPGDRRSAVLRVAAALAREHGTGFTMSQLGRRTGLSRATLYRRVGTKRELLASLERGGSATDGAPDPRQRIIDAARAVVADRGLQGATMERVAEAAGVGVATVYRHFGDRATLFGAFLRVAAARADVRARIDQPTGDLAVDLRGVARAALALFRDNRDLLLVGLGGSEAERDLVRALRGSTEPTLEHLASLFEREIRLGRLRGAQPARGLALAFVGMLFAFGVLAPNHYGLEPGDPEADAERCVRLFLDGAAA